MMHSKCSKENLGYINKHNINIQQLGAPRNHHLNTAEKSITMLKEYFITELGEGNLQLRPLGRPERDTGEEIGSMGIQLTNGSICIVITPEEFQQYWIRAREGTS